MPGRPRGRCEPQISIPTIRKFRSPKTGICQPQCCSILVLAVAIPFGARYKTNRSVVSLLMAGRSFEPSRANQSYFRESFGTELLLPWVVEIRVAQIRFTRLALTPFSRVAGHQFRGAFSPLGVKMHTPEVVSSECGTAARTERVCPNQVCICLQLTRVTFHRLCKPGVPGRISPASEFCNLLNSMWLPPHHHPAITAPRDHLQKTRLRNVGSLGEELH